MTLTIRISDTGSVEIPKSVREANGWTAGTELELVERGREVLLRPKEPFDLEDAFPKMAAEEFLATIPKVAGAPLEEKEIERIVLEEAARRFDAKTSR